MLDGKGFATVDPHGDLAEALIGMVPRERVEDIVYFNPSDVSNPIGLNLFEIDPNDPDPELTKDYLIASVQNMLQSLYDPNNQGIVGPRMFNIVRYASLLLMDSPEGGTFMDIPKVLVDPEFAKSKIPYLKRQQAIDFWTKEWPNSQRSNDAGEVTAWVVSKWADFQNTMLTNVLGQMKSGLNFREIMDEGKILLVNLSKGKMGELPSKLLGMVFVMKFQAAAMSRANIPEDQRRDFTLYVDEFQNFATDSFESILSEARKYRLSLVVANQFMTQLTDKIREAIIGNVGTVISGRIGVTDAEQMQKRFQPTFDAEDLTRLPNFTSIAQVLINSVPSAPFSMDFPPMMGHANQQLADALIKLSAAKYGRPRAEVELEIYNRLNAAQLAKEQDKQARLEAMRSASVPVPGKTQAAVGAGAPAGQPAAAGAAPGEAKPAGGSTFLDNWLSKRQQAPAGTAPANQPAAAQPATQQPQPSPQAQPAVSPQPPTPAPPQPTVVAQPAASVSPAPAEEAPMIEMERPKTEGEIEAEISEQLRLAKESSISEINEKKIIQAEVNELKIGGSAGAEIFIDLHGNMVQASERPANDQNTVSQ
jgi:hypothetical protein